MDYIDRIFPFPFLNHQAFLENKLTGYWVLATIFITILAILYVFFRGSAIKKAFKRRNPENHKILGPIWKAYKTTFSFYTNTEKSSVHAEQYFNEINVLYAFLNYRLVNNIASITVGIGILGTFVGLALGISGIKTTEGTEQLANSIDSLMAGMSTAFVTSIWGMGLSIIYTAIFKFWQTRISRVIQKKCVELDESYMITQQEVQYYRDQKQKEIIGELFNEYLVAETEEGKQLPKNVFRRMLEESEKQTKSLQSFAGDLGDSISAAMQTLVSENNNQISVLIEEKLVPVLEDLKEIKQDSGTKVIENAVEQLSNSMKEMLAEFKDSISSDTKNEMEDLAHRLSEVSISLNSVPNAITELTLQATDIFESLKESVSDSIKASNEAINQQNVEVQNAFIKAKEDYNESVMDIQAHMEYMLQGQKDNIKQVSSLSERIEEILNQNHDVNKQFDGLLFKSKELSQTFDRLIGTLQNNSQNVSKTTYELLEATKEFKMNIEGFIKRNQEIIHSQKEVLEKTQNVSESYINRFGIIENGLKNIFAEVQTGLQEYQKTTAYNLNHYLKEFSTQLTSAQDALSSNVGELSDLTNELTEQVERFNKMTKNE